MVAAAEPIPILPARSMEPVLGRLMSDPLWRKPLVPVALFATAGILLDRTFDVPFAPALVLAMAGLVGWLVTVRSARSGTGALCLWLTAGALAAAYHHAHINFRAADDIGLLTDTDGHPVVLRAVIDSEPIIYYQDPNSCLQSFHRTDPLQATLAVSAVRRGGDWVSSSGKVRLIASAYPADERFPDMAPDLHVGDEVEVTGMLATPRGPGNPGEFDSAAALRDQQISAILNVRKDPDAIVRLGRGWTGSLGGCLAVLRGWGQRRLKESIADEKQAGLAMALLLGKGAELTRSDWNKFIRTGVIHVLVISGQHMVVLSFLLWKLSQVLGIRRRRAALGIAGLLAAYALLVGAGLPVVRSAVVAGIACVGFFVFRPCATANTLAAAWLVIVACDPSDIFNHGCQLSFLSVAVLTWGASRWFESPSEDPRAATPRKGTSGFLDGIRWLLGVRYFPDPLHELIDRSRPEWQKVSLTILRSVACVYLVTATVWVAVAPLVAAHYHTLAPVAILILPPLALIASIALVAGFLLLLVSAFLSFLVPPLAWVTGHCMGLCENIVDWAGNLPGSHWTTTQIPSWWLWVFYVSLLAVLLLDSVRPYWRWFLLAGAGWICLGLVLPIYERPSDEMRCTFLAVGHGGCTVIEVDGRVLLYDVGAVAGPEVAQRQVIPYLLQRGIRRIDEVFLSHADLDHFNGLLLLDDDIPIGQVTLTPTFTEKETAAVRHVTALLKTRGIPIRVVHSGQTLRAGSAALEVLHPPAELPESAAENENSRSMVLLLRHEGHSILLTGDLVGPGISRLLSADPEAVDVLMAPHHGSKQSNTTALEKQLKPQVVISNQGPPPEGAVLKTVYPHAQCLDTWRDGAIEVRSQRMGLVVQTFRTGERLVIHKR